MAKLVTVKQVEMAPERFAGQRVKITGCTMVQAESSLDIMVDELHDSGMELPEGGCFGFMFMHASRPTSASIGLASCIDFLDAFVGIDSDAVVDFEGYVFPNRGLETLPDSFFIYIDSVKVMGEQDDVEW